MITSSWLRPKYSGPAMAVLGGGGRSSPAALLASISALMRLSTFTARAQSASQDNAMKKQVHSSAHLIAYPVELLFHPGRTKNCPPPYQYLAC